MNIQEEYNKGRRDFTGASLSGADLSDVDLTGASLNGASLSRANLSGANLRSTNLAGANLSRARLIGANLSGADLSDVDLIGANLTGANLTYVDLIGANLTGANLRRASLGGANLTGADLRGASLSRARLIGVNLRGADLRGADLSDVDLTGVDLSGAKGLLNASDFLSKNFEFDDKGLLVFKAIGNTTYQLPSNWKIEAGSFLQETVNKTPTQNCGCGVNVGTREFCERNYPNSTLWLARIHFVDLADVVVPYSTDGKFRAGRVELVKKIV